MKAIPKAFRAANLTLSDERLEGSYMRPRIRAEIKESFLKGKGDKNKIASVVVSTGSYLPKKIVTNDDLSKTLDTSDSWIFSRTGIKARHIANETETTAFMGAKAAAIALKKSHKKLSDIDGIIVATTTPDLTFPAVATKIQALIGAKTAFAFDLQAVCSGFVYALTVANSMILSGAAKNLLVIGAERFSKLVDWQDRSTAVLFGDGAGAVLLSAQKSISKGIVTCDIKSDGELENILKTDGGVTSTRSPGCIMMNGKEVFKQAVEKMSQVSKLILKKNGISAQEIDWVIPHQANFRIMSAIMDKLSISKEKLLSTIERHANTSAASIPIVMDFFSAQLKPGNLILITAAGGGFTWGAVLIRW